LKGIFQRRTLIRQNPRQQTHNPIYHHQRRQLPARKDVVPNRELTRDIVTNAVINPFIMACNQKKGFGQRKPIEQGLRQKLTVRGKINNLIVRALRLEGAQSLYYHIYPYHHARSAPVGIIIYASVRAIVV
jgi:hypothetical protein